MRKLLSTGWIEAFRDNVFALDTQYTTANTTISRTPAEIYDYEGLLVAKPILTIYDEPGNLERGSRVHVQTRGVRLVRKATNAKDALNEAQKLRDVLWNQFRFRAADFSNVLDSRGASEARIATVNQDGTALAEVILTYRVRNTRN